MKAIRKTDGKVIEVDSAPYFSMITDEEYRRCLSDGKHYKLSDLDFSVGEAKGTEGEVLSGWVARDSNGNLSLFEVKPERVRYMRNNNEGLWMAKSMTVLVSDSFPDLTWDAEPMEVEITIKPKKK